MFDKGILDFKIEGNGANLSVGQKQLICIARALISKIKVLLMDEATASIDKGLDSHIQAVIAKDLKDCTIVTVAHRLETILGYEKVLVMEKGEKIEEGAPKDLFGRGGVFCGMIKESKLENVFGEDNSTQGSE